MNLLSSAHQAHSLQFAPDERHLLAIDRDSVSKESALWAWGYSPEVDKPLDWTQEMRCGHYLLTVGKGDQLAAARWAGNGRLLGSTDIGRAYLLKYHMH